jgi:hypothetical protein
MSGGGGQIVTGGAMVAGGVMSGNPMAIIAGAGMILSGIGTLLHGRHGHGVASRHPIAPWDIVVGRAKVGGTVVYLAEFDNNNKYLDMVLVLGAHTFQSVDYLLFNNQRLTMDPVSGTSYTPVQQTVNILHISRANNVVTVILEANIPTLIAGDSIMIQNISGDYTLNGTFPVEQIISQIPAPPTGGPGSLTFTYLNGGAPAIVDLEGQAQTVWVDYQRHVHMEVLLGNQTATFPGMLNGTPNQGDITDLIQTPTPNAWTAECLLLGKTCVFLRLNYDVKYFAGGVPTISFLVHGKNDISDPRTSPPTVGYTENVALIIADYLTDTTWGFKALLGTEVPIPQLIAAANICDEQVALAIGGTEPRYSCNGHFNLTLKRGEVLQNLLTACAGRISYSGGQFVIYPAAWPGVSFLLGPPTGIPVAIASAVLSVISSFAQGSGYQAYVNFSIGSQSHWLFDNNPAGWAIRTNTVALNDADILAIQNSSAVVTYDIENSMLGTATPAAQLLIYDSWLDVTLADGSTEVWRATTVNAVPGTLPGVILNPGNAIDGDPTTYATIEMAGFSVFDSGPVLATGAYAPPEIVASPPDSSPPEVASTGTALSQAAGPFRWRPTVSIRDLFNGCKGTYVCPSNKWEPSDIPPYAQDTDHGYASGGGSPWALYPFGDANLFADGGDRRWRDIQLPFTISASMAQRLCKIELMRLRQQGTGTFSYNMALYQATALDVFQMTLPLLGWYEKLLEISAFRFKLDKAEKATLLGTEIDVQETDPSVYEWSTTEELTPEGYQQAALPSNVGNLDQLYTVNGQ